MERDVQYHGVGASRPIFIYWKRKVVCFNQIGSAGALEESGMGQKGKGYRCQLVMFPEPRRHARVFMMVSGKPISD